jgi:hypothetical protein
MEVTILTRARKQYCCARGRLRCDIPRLEEIRGCVAAIIAVNHRNVWREWRKLVWWREFCSFIKDVL